MFLLNLIIYIDPYVQELNFQYNIKGLLIPKIFYKSFDLPRNDIY